MRTPQPERIGSTELWSARLSFDKPRDINALQSTVTDYVAQSGITVVGYYMDQRQSLTLLRWPETREGYRSPTIPECNVALEGLAGILQPRKTEHDIIPDDRIHTMMGRKKDGYNEGEIAPLNTLTRVGLEGFTVMDGYMISARTTRGTGVEPYGEPVGILITPPEHEDEIHKIGEDLKQWHYAIERGTAGRTDFYETHWAEK